MNIRERIEELRARVANVRSRELQTLAEAAGWQLRKARGGHRMYTRRGHALPIPTHPGAIAPGTVRKILSQIEAQVE